MSCYEKFLIDLEKDIFSKHLLTHPFYQAWSQGLLSKECLQDYAKEYYHHVKAFPTYLSALHSHTEDVDTRKALLQNLIEEEAGYPNHPELWRQFALSLGCQSQDLDTHKPCLEMQLMIETFRNHCLHAEICEGLASLYAYESQIPAISESKIEGLKKHYEMKEESMWRYFSVHIQADEEHARVERELLKKHVNEQNAVASLHAAQKVLNSLWNFLSYLIHRYQIKALECYSRLS